MLLALVVDVTPELSKKLQSKWTSVEAVGAVSREEGQPAELVMSRQPFSYRGLISKSAKNSSSEKKIKMGFGPESAFTTAS